MVEISGELAPLIRPFRPPSPRRGEEICRNSLPYPKEAADKSAASIHSYASSHFTCSSVSAISSAERLSSSSAIVRGPISGMTGKGWAMT